MKWSWKVARIAGVDIYIHATFLLLVYLVGISYWNQHGTLGAVISGIGFILALFSCVVLHELGHSLTARRYGIQTRNITLLPIGGVAALEKMPDDPRQEINVSSDDTLNIRAEPHPDTSKDMQLIVQQHNARLSKQKPQVQF